MGILEFVHKIISIMKMIVLTIISITKTVERNSLFPLNRARHLPFLSMYNEKTNV